MLKKKYTGALALIMSGIMLTGCGSGASYANTTTAAGMLMETKEAEMNTEEYSEITENDFMSAVNNPLSTFSIDVDTASYANARRLINKGRIPPPSAVRTEEFLNYFKYDYPQPTDAPVSVTTEVADCPWNTQTKLMLIGVQAKEIDKSELARSNLVFIIDISGSMDSDDKLPLIKTAFGYLLENLTENDKISIVTYAGEDTVVLSGVTGDNKAAISTAINELNASGSTAGSEGIKTAYALAEQYYIEGGNNRVILATDGDLNVGITSEGELKRLIEDKRDSGVYLSVLGFGSGNIKDNKMETLADNGNGNYHYIDTRNEARRVLVEEMGGTLFTVANDVKIQVEFNPSTVKGYRLIGYENRLLGSEDFADDKKDAGEIGAGARCTALYEIALVGSEQEIRESDLKYQTPDASGSDEWLTVSLRYKDNGESESKLLSTSLGSESLTAAPSENLTFAADVAAFAMLLRESQYSGTATYAGIIESLSALDCVNGDELKAELLSLVERVKKLAD